MSSGFFAFFAHAGFVDALQSAGIQPAGYTGSSAGALVGACAAAGIEPSSVRETLFALRKEHFWDPAPGAGLLRGKLFRERLSDLLPARFEDTEPLAISVYDLLSRKTRARTNGDLPAAVHASCAVPMMFHPVWLDGRPHADGGIADRPGILGAPEGRLFYHHIASRSWWRPGVGTLPIPSRQGMNSLVLERLPRLGPTRLAGGSDAYRIAREKTLRALDLPFRRVRRMP